MTHDSLFVSINFFVAQGTGQEIGHCRNEKFNLHERILGTIMTIKLIHTSLRLCFSNFLYVAFINFNLYTVILQNNFMYCNFQDAKKALNEGSRLNGLILFKEYSSDNFTASQMKENNFSSNVLKTPHL